MVLLLKEQTLEAKDLKEFMGKNNYSRSTLYGNVIPKLVYFGLIKKEVVKGKGKPIKLTLSANFSEFFSVKKIYIKIQKEYSCRLCFHSPDQCCLSSNTLDFKICSRLPGEC